LLRSPPTNSNSTGLKSDVEEGLNTSDTADLETGTNLSGQLSLSTAQDNVQEFLVSGHRRNLAVKID
jgi:hypothetical protein